MKKDVSKVVYDLENEPLVNEKQQELSYGKIIGMLMLTPDESENAEQKLIAFEVANKVISANEVEFDADEVAFILKKSGKISSPLVYGRLHKFLEQPKKQK